MKKTKRLAVGTGACWAFVTLIALPGCSDKIDESEGSGTIVDTTPAAATIAPRAASITKPNRTDDDVKDRAASLLQLFPGGARIARADMGAGAAIGTARALGARQLPQVRVDYEAKTDTFEAVDLDLFKVRDGVEVSETVARQRFEGVLTSLVARGIVGDKDYAVADAKLSRVMQGEGSSTGGPPVESIKEYRYFVPRKIGGIIVNDGGQHDLGIRVMIHRSGALRGIRISGAGLGMALGASVPETVAASELDRRVQADFASSTIQPLGLRYSLDAPSGEPRRAYWVSYQTVVQGHPVNARASIVYYSVTDPSRAPDIWPTPNPDDKSDRPRVP